MFDFSSKISYEIFNNLYLLINCLNLFDVSVFLQEIIDLPH